MVDRSRFKGEGPVVLVAIDRSESATEVIEVAARLARNFDGVLEILHVVENVPRHREGLDFPLTKAELLSEGEDVLRSAAEHAKASFDGIIRGQLTSGGPSEEIVAAAMRRRAEFIVVGTHGRTGVARVFLGSVAEQVVRRAPCPVVVARRSTPQMYDGPSRAIEIPLRERD